MRERERRRRERKRERERERERAIILGGKKKRDGHLIHLRKRNCTDFVNLQLTSISTFPSRTSAFHGNVHLEAAAMPAKNHPRQLTSGKPGHQTAPPKVVLWYQPPRSVKRLEEICAFFFPLICRWWQLGDALEMCIHGSHQSWEFSPWFHLVRRNELEGSVSVGSLGSVEVPVESLAFGGRLGRWWGELCFVPNAPRFLGIACLRIDSPSDISNQVSPSILASWEEVRLTKSKNICFKFQFLFTCMVEFSMMCQICSSKLSKNKNCASRFLLGQSILS